MKFVSKLLLSLAFMCLIQNTSSAYSVKEAKESVKTGCNNTVNWVKKNPYKAACAIFFAYSAASYLHFHTKKIGKWGGGEKAKEIKDHLKKIKFSKKFIAALILPVKETLSLCLDMNNPARVAMKSFINQTLLGLPVKNLN